MKAAVYIEPELQQIVLTPESPVERAVLDLLREPKDISVLTGAFYETNGGWIMHSASPPRSIILMLRPPVKSEPVDTSEADRLREGILVVQKLIAMAQISCNGNVALKTLDEVQRALQAINPLEVA